MAGWNIICYCPAYNVEKSLPEFLSRMQSEAGRLSRQGVSLKALIIVDDASKDSTPGILASHKKSLPLIVLRNAKNSGPTGSLFRGMGAAMKLLASKKLPPASTILVRLDTDLEHQPEDISRMIEPIMLGRAKITSGFVPLDSRNGSIAEWFNKSIGKSESREFAGVEIPQFCPGFNAVRADAAKKLYPVLEKAAGKFMRQYSIPMLTIDIVILALAKRLGLPLSAIRLRPIEDRWIKKFGLAKTIGYLAYHRKTTSFLRNYST